MQNGRSKENLKSSNKKRSIFNKRRLKKIIIRKEIKLNFEEDPLLLKKTENLS